MTITLAYGREGMLVLLPEKNVRQVVTMQAVEPLPEPQSAVRESYMNPLGSEPLTNIAEGRRDAVIVISDTTRPVPNELLLTPMLEILEKAGIPRKKILILIATGIHRLATEEEILQLVGKRIAEDYRVFNHDAEDDEMHEHITTLEDGTPVMIDRRYLEADLKILTGFVELHLMAGYSGGRKSVLPGIASLQTLKHLHGFRMIQQDATTYGRLADNPFHQASVNVARMVGADFITNVTLNDSHRVTGVFSGELEQAHEAACTFLDTYAVRDLPGPADIVLTTGGGAPLDATLYQSLKGLVTALKAVKKGGTVVLAAENREGMGSPEFTALMHRLKCPEEFFQLSRKDNYIAKDQWMLQELMNGLHHVDVICCSGGLTEDQIRDCFMFPAATVEEGVGRALDQHGPDAGIIVLPEGPYILPRTDGAIEKLYSWFEMM